MFTATAATKMCTTLLGLGACLDGSERTFNFCQVESTTMEQCDEWARQIPEAVGLEFLFDKEECRILVEDHEDDDDPVSLASICQAISTLAGARVKGRSNRRGQGLPTLTDDDDDDVQCYVCSTIEEQPQQQENVTGNCQRLVGPGYCTDASQAPYDYCINNAADVVVSKEDCLALAESLPHFVVGWEFSLDETCTLLLDDVPADTDMSTYCAENLDGLILSRGDAAFLGSGVPQAADGPMDGYIECYACDWGTNASAPDAEAGEEVAIPQSDCGTRVGGGYCQDSNAQGYDYCISSSSVSPSECQALAEQTSGNVVVGWESTQEGTATVCVVLLDDLVAETDMEAYCSLLLGPSFDRGDATFAATGRPAESSSSVDDAEHPTQCYSCSAVSVVPELAQELSRDCGTMAGLGYCVDNDEASTGGGGYDYCIGDMTDPSDCQALAEETFLAETNAAAIVGWEWTQDIFSTVSRCSILLDDVDADTDMTALCTGIHANLTYGDATFVGTGRPSGVAGPADGSLECYMCTLVDASNYVGTTVPTAAPAVDESSLSGRRERDCSVLVGPGYCTDASATVYDYCIGTVAERDDCQQWAQRTALVVFGIAMKAVGWEYSPDDQSCVLLWDDLEPETDMDTVCSSVGLAFGYSYGDATFAGTGLPTGFQEPNGVAMECYSCL